MDGRILHITSLISNDLAHSWTVEEMAKAVNISSPHLHKLFKAETGVTPMEHLITLRLEKAREMLETGFLQVKQIGVKVGMTVTGHLTREFAKKYGISPIDYRNKYLNENAEMKNILK